MNFLALLNESRVKAGKAPLEPMTKTKGKPKSYSKSTKALKASAIESAVNKAVASLGKPAKPKAKPMTPLEKTVARVKAEYASKSGPAKTKPQSDPARRVKRPVTKTTDPAKRVNQNPAKRAAEAGIKPI